MNSKPLASTPCRLLLLALLAAGALLVAAPRAGAAPCGDSFSATVGNGWNTDANWSKGETPSAEENVCLEAGSAAVIAAGQSAGAATVTGPVPVRIEAGGSLTIATSADLQGANVVDGEILGAGATVTLKSGSLVGTGTIAPRFINEAGTVEPGGDGAVGTMSFGSQYAQDEAGTLDLDLASDSSFDRLQPPANQNALIAGHIDVAVLGGYAPAVGTTWDFVSGIGGASWFGTASPSQFSVHSVPGGAEVRLDSALPSDGETPTDGAPESNGPTQTIDPIQDVPMSPVDSSTQGQSSSPLAPSGSASTEVTGQCSEPLTLRAAIKGGHLTLTGTAPRSAAGKRVRILRGARAVAKAKVRANGSFRAKASAPKRSRRASVAYVAAIGRLRSCPVRLR
jgi:hypothetical protein